MGIQKTVVLAVLLTGAFGGIEALLVLTLRVMISFP